MVLTLLKGAELWECILPVRFLGLFSLVLWPVLQLRTCLPSLCAGNGSRVGSASMMTAAVGSLSVMYPQMADQIAAFGAASNMLSGLDGLYMCIWMALPLTEWLYKKSTA